MAKAAMKTPPAKDASVPRRKFTQEFKQAAVARVQAGERAAAVAEELGVGVNNLYIWCHAGKSGAGEHETRDFTRPHEGVPAGASRALVRENALLKLELKFMRDRESLLNLK